MPEIQYIFDDYAKILDAFVEAGYNWADYTESPGPKTVVLRHDIDYSPRKALRMASMEAQRDITGTYFFLVRSPFYNVLDPDITETLRAIADEGHDIGLHFSTHPYWDEEPPESELIEPIEMERHLLEIAVEDLSPAIAFHNPPSWTLNRTFNSFVSTYEPRFFDDIEYIADSNQRWRESNPFTDNLPYRVQLLTHPLMWGDEPGSVVDRLQMERDYLVGKIESEFDAQNRIWGPD